MSPNVRGRDLHVSGRIDWFTKDRARWALSIDTLPRTWSEIHFGQMLPMTVRLIFAFAGKNGIVLYEGITSECPPIPRDSS